MSPRLRSLTDDDVPKVISLWHDGWHEAHAHIVPEELVRLRTRESFKERLQQHKDNARVAIAEGVIGGLCILRKDELFQIYVAPGFRGTGLAQRLVGAAENRLRQKGYKRAWLACAVGNERAARFYRKGGWIEARTEELELDTSQGPFLFKIWRYEKDL